MKFLVLFLSIFINFVAHAEDGLFTRFVFDKQEVGSDLLQSYNTGVLAEFNSSATLDIASLYQLSITNRLLNSDTVNIYISLKDISSGKPYNVGSDAQDFVVGEQQVFKFTNNGYQYSVKIDTSFSKLP
ncbi:hypothetical protein [Alteromonas portus]|uniref:hypothetical protein n=1 Tax=Alteromonas portus TaxID=2565549 RepID=UPI003BF78BE3